MKKEDKRFVVTYKQSGVNGAISILVDRKTGVNYLYRAIGYSGGLTVLLDRDGKPVVTPIHNEELP